jgi:hypothetical protein
MSIGNLFGTGGESNSLYGTSFNSDVASSFIYFEWFIFKVSTGQPAIPTGGSWDFATNTGIPPTGWTSTVAGVPLDNLWFSIAFVDSRNPTNIVWSTTSLLASSTSVYSTAYADTFTGTGSTTVWTLTADPVVVNNLDVSINGVTQTPTVDYTISGTTFTTTTAAPLGSIILVKYRQALPNSYFGTANNVGYTPFSWIAATNVQAALNEVATDVSATDGVSGSNLVGYKASGTGAVATTVQAKLRQYVSVKDFGAVGDGVTNDTAAINAALATYKSVLFPNGTYMTTGNHELLYQHPSTSEILRQSLIGEGNAVIKKLSGTNVLLKCQQQTQATVSNLTFDGNSLGGSAILWRGHYSVLDRLKFKNQGGSSYALWFSGVNTSQFNDLEFGDSCYGGVLIDNANDPITPAYGMLYSDIFKLQIGSTNGGSVIKFAPSSTAISVTFNDCLIEGNTGGFASVIDLDAQLQKSITFNNINGEYANLGTFPYIYIRGDESVDISFNGGYWVSNFAQNISTPVLRTDIFVRGLTVNNVYFSENFATSTSVGRTLIYLEDARNVSITNCTTQFINDYFFVESAAANLNTYVTLANNFQYNINLGGGANFAGIATCVLQTDFTNVSNTNMLVNVSTTQKYSIQNSNQVRSARAAGAITVVDDGYYEIHGDGGVSAAGDWAGTVTIRCGAISATSKNNFATFYAQTGSGAGFPDHTDISVGSNVEILDQDNTVAALANTTDGKLGVQIGYAGGGANRYIRIYNRTGASVTLFADVLLMV